MTNSDKYKTVEERKDAFWKQHTVDMNPYDAVWRLLKWLDKEAEEDKPLPCPFCGHELTDKNMAFKHKRIGFFGWSYHCPECGYCSSYMQDKHAAIDEHNRVAIASMKERENAK